MSDQIACNEKAQKILIIFFLNLSKDLKNVIENCDYPKEALELLISHFIALLRVCC